jgi:uncharacterized protein with HEPN domain
MSKRDPMVALRQMSEAAREAMELTAGRSRSDLDSNRLLSLALVRLLEVLGEAASRVPGEARELHPDIPWAEMIGMRHRLIHGYDQVDHDIVWAVLSDDLPSLVTALEHITGSASTVGCPR